MKKQFTYFISMLALGAALVGCGNSSQEAIASPDVTQEIEVTTEPEETPAVEAEEITEEVTETPTTDEVKPEDQTVATEVTPSITPNPEATTESSNTEAKPSTGSSTTTKPSTGSSSTTKPSTDSSSTTTTPNSGSSSTPTQPNSGTTTPEVKPETKPEAIPEVKPETKPEVSLSASELYAKAVAGVELPKQMEMDDALISDVYGIDTSLLKSYKGMLPMMSAHINECVIFELKDAKDADKVIAGINTRADNVGRFLYPSLQEAFDARQVVTQGNYVLFVMDDAVNTIVANFKAALQ